MDSKTHVTPRLFAEGVSPMRKEIAPSLMGFVPLNDDRQI